MKDKQTCPRRGEIGQRWEEGKDTWTVRGRRGSGLLGDGLRTCSYCGSLHPDDFMTGIEESTYQVGPTDKNYKAYVGLLPSAEEAAAADVRFEARIKDFNEERQKHERQIRMDFGVRDVAKFYYQHLSEDQRRRFVDLYNDHTMKIGYPHHFYVNPFFMTRV